MRATFKLLNVYFWKTIYGPILAFVFPTLLLAILGNIMRIEYVLPGILSMATLFIAVQAMPLGLMEMKNSTLLKYIGSTPVNSKKFIISTVLFYVFINMLSIALLLVMGSFIFYNKVFLANTHEGLYSGLATIMGMFSFITANLLHIILSLSIGITIAVFSKTPQQALTISLMTIIPSMFLSGMVLSVDVIAKSAAMQWISRMVIFRYTTGNIVVAMTPENQIGDLMDIISLDNKRLVFNIVGQQISDKEIKWLSPLHDHGLIISQDGRTFTMVSDVQLDPNFPAEESKTIKENGHDITINVSHFTKRHGAPTLTLPAMIRQFKGGRVDQNLKDIWFQSGDSTLFDTVFTKVGASTSTDNNMFRWYKAFGVRKIPDVDAIRDFIQTFFRGKNGGTTSGDKPERFIFIWEEFIKKNRYGFLELFTKQNVVLYTMPERILNTLLPLTMIGGLTGYSARHFKWSAR